METVDKVVTKRIDVRRVQINIPDSATDTPSNRITASSSCSSFFDNSECEEVSGEKLICKKQLQESSSPLSGSVTGVNKSSPSNFDENKYSVKQRLMYRRYIRPSEEIKKVAVDMKSLMQSIMKLVGQAQREKKQLKIAVIFCNSYAGTANDLGDCAINDGLLTYDSLNGNGDWAPFIIYDCMKEECVKIMTSVIKLPAISEVCFYFIGHGTRMSDLNGDEADRYDELMVFRDGLLRDDRIAEEIVKAYPINMQKKKLILIADCCHSGTIFDVSTIRKSSKKIPVIGIGACSDNQTAKQEWFGFGDSGAVYKGNGVFSHYFWKAVNERDNDGSVEKFGFDMDMKKIVEEINPKMSRWGMKGVVE